MTTPGLCRCGCGRETAIASKSRPERGIRRGAPNPYVRGHGRGAHPEMRGENHPRWKGGVTWNAGYKFVYLGRVDGYVAEHILVASDALGKPLPKGAHVHHVNGDKSDNRSENLVVCQDNSYHKLLHFRQKALDACGHAGWRQCCFCRQWCEPSEMSDHNSKWYHRACRNRDLKAKRDKKMRRLSSVL